MGRKRKTPEPAAEPLAAPEQPPGGGQGGPPPGHGPPDVPPGQEKKTQISLELSLYTPLELVGEYAVNAFVLAGGPLELPAPPASRAVGDPDPLEGERPPTVPTPPEAEPAITPFTEQPESDLGPIPRVGFPGIRTETDAPPREVPPEPFPPDLPEGP